jgi:xanthine/uracil permease
MVGEGQGGDEAVYRLEDEDGVSAGLTVWLIFVVVLFLIGTPAVLSILLGLFGGFAAGWIIACVRADKLDDAPKTEQDKPSVIQPVQKLVDRIPVFRLRPKRVALFRSKPPRRIGK